MRIIAIILLCCGFANATALDENTIFDGDVYGTYNNLRLRVAVSSDTTATTTVVSYSGADITDINAANITTGILSNYRLDSSSVTLQGNIFNVSNRLLKILTSGYIWNDLIDSGTWISTNTVLGGDLSGYLPNPSVVNDSHNHSQISVTGLRVSTKAITSADVDSTVLIATSPAGGDTTGTLSNLQVIDDSHNHHANSLYDVFLASQSVYDLPSSSSTISHNAGVLQPVNITDATGVAVALSSATVLIRDNANWTGQLYYKYVAANSSLALTDDSVNFIYITWNSGVPIYGATTDRSVINNSNYVPVARVYMQSGNIGYQLLNGNIGLDLTIQGYDRVMRIRGQQGFEKESGLAVSCSSTSPNISVGYLFFGYRRMTLAAYSVATEDNMWIYTHSGGNWIETKTASINNSYYDNGTSTVALTANRYAVNYLFRRVNESINELDIVVGTGDYTLAQALAAVGTIPVVPQSFTYFYYPVGAIIIQAGATTPTQVVTYTPDSGITFASASNHGDLLGLGNDDHLIYALLAGRGGQTFDDNIHVNGSLISSTTIRAPEFCIGLITPSCITAWPSGGSGGGNTYTTGGVAGQLAYYSDTSTITASGIKPSQVLTSTNTTVARTNAQNTFSVAVDGGAAQTFYNTSTNAAASMGHYIQSDTSYTFFRAFSTGGTYSGASAWESSGNLFIGTNNGSSGRLTLFTNDYFFNSPRLVIEPAGAITALSSATFNAGVKASSLAVSGAETVIGSTTIQGAGGLSVTYGIATATATTTSTATLASVSVTGKADFSSVISTATFRYADIAHTLTVSTFGVVDAQTIFITSICAATTVPTSCTVDCQNAGLGGGPGYYISGLPGYFCSGAVAPYAVGFGGSPNTQGIVYYTAINGITYAYAQCRRIK